MITGLYSVEKMASFINEELDYFTIDQVRAELERQIEAGDTTEEDAAEILMAFDTRIEFKENGDVITWSKAPEGYPEEEIKAALEEGEFLDYKDGYIAVEKSEWKEEDGVIVYDSKEQIEIGGEEQSPWLELKYDDDGLMIFGHGMMLLKKID